MGKKLERTVTKATYGLLGIAMKPIYDQMKKEKKEEDRRWNKLLKQANEDAMIEANYRRFEVHQPFDALIHYHPLW